MLEPLGQSVMMTSSDQELLTSASSSSTDVSTSTVVAHGLQSALNTGVCTVTPRLVTLQSVGDGSQSQVIAVQPAGEISADSLQVGVQS